MAVTTTVAECSFAELADLGSVTLVAKLGNGKEVLLGSMDPRYFSTGSYGMGLNGKVSIPIAGKNCRMQASVNFTVIGSKGAAKTGVTFTAASTPAVIVPNGPAALYDKTTKQGTLFPSSDMARSIKAVCPNGFYSRCEVITESSPEWTVAKQTCSIEVAKGVAML